MNKYLKLGMFGFVSWLVPFVAAFMFYSQEGQLLVDVSFFKSVMAVVGSLTGAVLLVLYFGKVKEKYLNEGILAGVVFFVMNLVLDLLVLVPMAKMNIGDYFLQIGLMYLVILIMGASMGYALEKKGAK